VIESVKAASDLYAPVSGTVSAINESAPEDPDVLKRDTYGEGWLIRIEGVAAEEYEALMDEEAYKEFLKSEAE
jgi:glycine cleavage system H protein